MSDNDLIRRGDTLKELEHTLFYDERDQRTAVECVKSKPAVPHEMTAREFAELMLRNERWCIKTSCPVCKHRELCEKVAKNRTDKFTIPTAANAYVELIEQWAKEHPEKKQKNYAEHFFEKFPNSPVNDNHPAPCRASIYGTAIKGCNGYYTGDCAACWNEVMEEEE